MMKKQLNKQTEKQMSTKKTFEMRARIVDARITPDYRALRVSLELTDWVVDQIELKAPRTGETRESIERMQMKLATLGQATGVPPLMEEQLIGRQVNVILNDQLGVESYCPCR